MSKEYAYSEIFYSMQGEGHYTGEPTAWLRFFLCNLQCDGFGQKDPTDPSSYILPYQNVNVDDYDQIENLPVFEYGCDSSYSWSKKFKHLQNKATVDVIAERIMEKIPGNSFNNNIHMCFTGGEPLMKHGQEASIGVLDYINKKGDRVPSVTYETNGTQALTDDFCLFFDEWQHVYGNEIFFSVSPKLWTVAGEKRERAIKPENLSKYHLLSTKGQLKFVANGTQESWDEIDEVVELFRERGIDWPVWIMPVGATLEGQKGELEGHMTDGDVASQALARGHRVSARVHVYLWGNKIGV